MQVHVETKSASQMFELLRRNLAHTESYPHLLSALQHCLMLPCNVVSVHLPQLRQSELQQSVFGPHCDCVFADKQSSTTRHYWVLLDRIVQQLVLQTDKGQNPDVAPLEDFNVRNVISM